MNKERILVVDDERLVFDSIEDTLGDDYQLYHAENGLIALRLLEEYQPVLIILDIKMPVMDGFEFLKRVGISMDDPYSVIVLSAHAEGADVAACYNLGITSFLRKPFNIFELKGLVKQCIQAKRQYQSLRHERQYIRAIFDYSMDIILVIDNGFNIVDSNPAAEQACGYEMLALQGVSFKSLFADPEQFAAVALFLTTGQPFSEDIMLLQRGGEAFAVVLKLAVLHDASGDPITEPVVEDGRWVWAKASLLLTQQSA
ncbi:MAG: response regulator [Magnetococcus sp. XQGC-1]